MIYLKKENCGASGIISPSDWINSTVQQRIVIIENDLKNADENNQGELRKIGGNIRQVWEQSVEDKLFNRTITRFEHAVHTGNLEIVRIDDSLYPMIEDGMTKTSKWVDHDIADMDDTKILKSEVEEELANLKKFFNSGR